MPNQQNGQGGQGFLWLGTERGYYRGPLSTSEKRVFGAHVLYVAAEGRFQAVIGGSRLTGDRHWVIAPAYQAHTMLCSTPNQPFLAYVIEPEACVTPQLMTALESWCARRNQAQRVDGLRRLERRIKRDTAIDTDRLMFGRSLARRPLDPRIDQALQVLRENPKLPHAAGCLAESCELSRSRFLHLFREETGLSFRRFRAWRRARHVMARMGLCSNLTRLAVDLGYPDATHFSHSVRRTYGLKATDLRAILRRTELRIDSRVA